MKKVQIQKMAILLTFYFCFRVQIA